tara:strand:- start:322 stop:540 length:219 start_codon:yes stop_codon:yes gene_type:complete
VSRYVSYIDKRGDDNKKEMITRSSWHPREGAHGTPVKRVSIVWKHTLCLDKGFECWQCLQSAAIETKLVVTD